MEYNSTEFCSGSQERRPVSSVIQFHCNTNVPDSVSKNRNENIYIGILRIIQTCSAPVTGSLEVSSVIC